MLPEEIYSEDTTALPLVLSLSLQCVVFGLSLLSILYMN